jgi:hypothetical protein
VKKFCNVEIKLVIFISLLYLQQKEERPCFESFLFRRFFKIVWRVFRSNDFSRCFTREKEATEVAITKLFQEERERDQRNDKQTCKRADAFEVFLHHAVIGIELFAGSGGA